MKQQSKSGRAPSPRAQITLATKVVSMLQKGDRVIIYQDPITKQKPEGTAHLVGRVGDADPEQQNWEVRFEGETNIYRRFISPPWEVIDDKPSKPVDGYTCWNCKKKFPGKPPYTSDSMAGPFHYCAVCAPVPRSPSDPTLASLMMRDPRTGNQVLSEPGSQEVQRLVAGIIEETVVFNRHLHDDNFDDALNCLLQVGLNHTRLTDLTLALSKANETEAA